MSTSEPGTFRLRQSLADLNRQKLQFPLATVRRIGAGIPLRDAGVPDVQRRLEWYFSGKAPVAQLRRDRLVQGAVLMASALPEDDFDSFIAATVLLLVERLTVDGRTDNGFWNWKRMAPHYRLTSPDLRASIMCGFREARRIGRVILADGPGADECLTTPRAAGLDALRRNRVEFPLLSLVEWTVREEADARLAGALWASQHRAVAGLPDGPRAAALAGFRYLYERPLSMEPPSGASLPVIPGPD